jgi:hypothetical protein
MTRIVDIGAVMRGKYSHYDVRREALYIREMENKGWESQTRGTPKSHTASIATSASRCIGIQSAAFTPNVA